VFASDSRLTSGAGVVSLHCFRRRPGIDITNHHQKKARSDNTISKCELKKKATEPTRINFQLKKVLDYLPKKPQ